MSQSDDDAIWNGPAILINRVFLVRWNDHSDLFRLSFCEQGGPDRDPVHRIAIAIDRDMAHGLVQLLTGALRDDKAQEGVIAGGKQNEDGEWERTEVKKQDKSRAN